MGMGMEMTLKDHVDIPPLIAQLHCAVDPAYNEEMVIITRAMLAMVEGERVVNEIMMLMIIR